MRERYGREAVALWEEPPSSHDIHFTYDANHHLIQVKDSFGACIRYAYDCLGNVIQEQKRISGEVWQKIRYEYDKAGRRISKTEQVSQEETAPHKRSGSHQALSYARTTYSYDKNGNLTTIVTPNGYKVLREYDLSDRLITERMMDEQAGIDRRLTFTYDHGGNIITLVQSGKGVEPQTYTYEYDWKNRLIEKEIPESGSYQYRYDKNDRLTEEKQDQKPQRYQTYDRQGNVLAVSNGFGELVKQFSYDSSGRICSQQNGTDGRAEKQTEAANQSNQAATNLFYTPDGRQREIQRGNQTLASYTYQPQGGLKGMTDGNQNQTRFETDGWGRITKVIHADGSEEGYAYNEAGLVTETRDGNGNQIRYEYNRLGKVSRIVDQEGESEYFYYDYEGNLIETIDRNQNRVITSYTMDGNILLQKAVKADGSGEIMPRYDYDALGRIKRAISGNLSYTYEYTDKGQLKRKSAGGRTLLAYTYHSNGRMAALEDVTGKRVFYEYDSLNRISHLRDDSGNELVRYEYDSQNRIRETKYANGLTTAYAYDEDGNILHLLTKDQERIYLDYHYTYDGNGNRIGKHGFLWNGEHTPKQESIRFLYDQKNQLIEEVYGNEQNRYEYDKVGNRIWEEKKGSSYVLTYNQKNQLVAKRGEDNSYFFTYDQQGNLTEETAGGDDRQNQVRYTYDSLNRQSEIVRSDLVSQRNRYDGEGLRAEMEENGRISRFIFHHGELINEEDVAEVTLPEQKKVSRYIRGYGAEYLEQGGESYQVQKDEQNSTVFLLNESHEIANRYEYDGFGNLREERGKAENRILYTGQQYDQTVGQYYLRARYYNPRIGRFTQEDVYRGDGLNLYAYCANNPIMYYDPSGYCLQTGFEDTQRGMLSDYLGVPELGSDGKFYYILNNNGGKVYVSVIPIDQDDFMNIVLDGQGQVNIISGIHGDTNGGIIPHRQFFYDDMNEFGGLSNVSVYDFTEMDFGSLNATLNSSGTNILAWCYSERNPVVRMSLKGNVR